MDALVILNENAGTGANGRDEIGPNELIAAFAASGVRSHALVARAGQLDDILREAVVRRPEAIFVGGGDGTISAAAAHLADTGIPLGVLPFGTLNHFARDLGVPLGWREAVPAYARAAIREVDLGEVNGRIFINNCSLGTYAEAVRKRDALQQRHGLRKWWAMTFAAFSVFAHLRRMRLGIEIDDGAMTVRTPFLLVSNNRYDGHALDGCFRGRLDEGRLWLHTTRVHRRFTMLRLALQALRRRLDDLDHLESRPFSAATVTARRDPAIAVDGELANLRPPLQFRIRPRALRVLVPPTNA